MDARLARSDNAPIGGGTARGAARNGAQPRRDVFDQRNATQRNATHVHALRRHRRRSRC